MQQPVELEETGVWIAAQVEDMSGRFNLNSVVKWDDQTKLFVADHHQVDVFRTLLADLDIDQRYADLLVDWIDTGHRANGSAGGEDTLYLSQVPALPPSQHLHHPPLGAAGTAGIRSRQLSQDRTVRHRPAL